MRLRTWLSWRVPPDPKKRAMSGSELTKFFDEYCARWNYTKQDARDKKLWWAMFYTWKGGGYWYEDDRKEGDPPFLRVIVDKDVDKYVQHN